VFGLFPISVKRLVLRVTLALPFWKSGLTKWDGWLTLSFGAKTLFADEFKLHVFGALSGARADGVWLGHL
jgi:putative oxidoreductase